MVGFEHLITSLYIIVNLSPLAAGIAIMLHGLKYPIPVSHILRY